MKLRRVRVQNYRSIVDSGTVNIEDCVTVLIGKNEQGKTTFLKALASAAPSATYTSADLPNHLQVELQEGKASELPVLTMWLEPDDGDLSPLQKSLDTTKAFEAIKLVKYFDAHRVYYLVGQDGAEEPLKFTKPDTTKEIQALKTIAQDLSGKLTAHAARLPTFQPNAAQAQSLIEQFLAANFSDASRLSNLIQTFSTGLASVPGQDAAVQQDISDANNSLVEALEQFEQKFAHNQTAAFEKLLPVFVYHSSTLDKIPDEVDVAEFITNSDKWRGMANLCGVAGLSLQKIQELASNFGRDRRSVEAAEDHFTDNMSGAINEYWTQEKYRVSFRIDSSKMSVSISDGTYDRRIPPSDRSEGFQWYLSFYATLQNEVTKAGSTIFLLDNPGLELHADGQRDIKAYLEERLMPKAQIVYVTHSPAMIDPFQLEQVRKVELQPGMAGTKVSEIQIKEGTDFDLFDPVRMAIGASLATSLILNELNVLVEGAADKPILEGAFEKYQAASRHKILVNGSVSESKDDFLVRFYERAKVPYVVYVDADSKGREIAQRLRRSIPADRIVELSSVIGKQSNDLEIEDLISSDVYYRAIKAEYPTLPIERTAGGQSKRTNQYEKMFKDNHWPGFAKRRIAARIKAMVFADDVDDETRENLKRLSAALLQALERQVDGAHETTEASGTGKGQEKAEKRIAVSASSLKEQSQSAKAEEQDSSEAATAAEETDHSRGTEAEVPPSKKIG